MDFLYVWIWKLYILPENQNILINADEWTDFSLLVSCQFSWLKSESTLSSKQIHFNIVSFSNKNTGWWWVYIRKTHWIVMLMITPSCKPVCGVQYTPQHMGSGKQLQNISKTREKRTQPLIAIKCLTEIILWCCISVRSNL